MVPKVTMASAKTPDVVDLTKENKDRSGSVEKNKKIKQMRLPFKKINAEEYKINLQESLEKAKTTNDDSKKRKISTDSVDEETNAAHCKFSDFLFTFHFLGLFLSKVANRFMTLEKNCQMMKV